MASSLPVVQVGPVGDRTGGIGEYFGEAAEVEPRLRICPHCGAESLTRNGSFKLATGRRKQRYLCHNCGRTCNADTGKPSANLKRREAWDKMEAAMEHSHPLRYMAFVLGVHLSTAFRWRHRWLAARHREPKEPLDGQVAVATVTVPYSEKGSRTCRGPGSWGYWNTLRHGPRPGAAPTRPGRNGFRPLIDGRASTVLVAQTASEHASTVLGQRPGVEQFERGMADLVSQNAEVYGFASHSNIRFVQACEKLNLSLRKGQPFGAPDKTPGGRSLQAPLCPVGWLTQFKGVATKYLHHYMTWFSYQITAILQTTKS